MALLEDIKVRLRLINSAYDQEVTDLIEDAKKDLVTSGLKASIMTAFESDPTDPLIKNAIAFYVKAHFGYNNDDREGLIESYEMRKTKLTLDKDYMEELVE